MEKNIMYFKKFLCRIGWHDWTPWGQPVRLPDERGQQFRMCTICQKQQRHIF